VLTVRELVQLLQLYGIDMDMLDGRHTDEPLDMGSSSSILAEISGGLTEAVIRLIAGQYNIDVPSSAIRNLRTGGNFRELEISSGKRVFNFAVVDGLSGLGKLRDKMKAVNYDMIEVMACPSGCVNGGGINIGVSGKGIKDRVKLMYKYAEKSVIHLPMDNPALHNFYEKWLPANKELASGKPFRNKYSKRDVLL